MRIVMLGWEFPPFISGGLGTACQGLTAALDKQGHQVVFVLPRPAGKGQQGHVRVLAPQGGAGGQVHHATHGVDRPFGTAGGMGVHHPEFTASRIMGVPAGFASPYGVGGQVGLMGTKAAGQGRASGHAPDGTPLYEDARHGGWPGGGVESLYQGDLFIQAEQYARLVVAMVRGEQFDVIHAHDWLTFPAGIALSRVTGKPLIVHVHSTEYDRAGDAPSPRVCEVERCGMASASRVLAVSELTKNLVVQRYAVPAAKVDVVYNGIDDQRLQPAPGERIQGQDKIVLFLGRITMQKGPEFFLAAARRVLEKVPEAKFIMAGAGDMHARMVELAAQLGIGHRVLFTGFLQGEDVDRVYRMADCYVMPSVSEPFGIAPLEAIRAGAPVIISKQSGVGEVLTHALKVDFWDTDEMANKIVAVLRHPPLGQTMREHGSFALRALTWERAGLACVQSYQRAISDAAELIGT